MMLSFLLSAQMEAEIMQLFGVYSIKRHFILEIAELTKLCLWWNK